MTSRGVVDIRRCGVVTRPFILSSYHHVGKPDNPLTMPKTRSTDATNWEHLAESYETWLEDGSVLKTLVLRIVRQRLGRGSAVGDVALRDAFNALRAAAVRFADATMDEGAAADAGRDEMEEAVAEAVLAWLDKLSQIPAAWDSLSWSEQDAAGADSGEQLVSFRFDAVVGVPDVPDVERPLKRTRVVEVEIEDDPEYQNDEAGRQSSENEEVAAKPQAGPGKKGAKRARVAGGQAQMGPLAAKKVRRSFFITLC